MKLGGWKQFNHYAPEFLNHAIFTTDYGLYAVIDQQIWKGVDDKSISVFARVSGSPDRPEPDRHLCRHRRRVLGLRARPNGRQLRRRLRLRQDLERPEPSADGSGQIRFASDVISDYESVLEVNYLAKIRPGSRLCRTSSTSGIPAGALAATPIRRSRSRTPPCSASNQYQLLTAESGSAFHGPNASWCASCPCARRRFHERRQNPIRGPF